MCGVVGSYLHHGIPSNERAVISSLSGLMRRRGPDDSGQWTDGAHVTFGFRRLSILDVTERASQPMLSEDGRHAIVFNGELYNYRELRRTLEGRGHRFKSTGDTEVLLRSLITWGSAAVERFNGMFAFAWYNTQARRLVLARDAMGIKPLYYLEAPEGLVFGSQFDQMLRHPLCSGEVDPTCVALYLRLSFLPPPFSLVSGVSQLEPGCLLTVEPGKRLRLSRYAAFPAEAVTAPLADAVERVDDAVAQAVARQMVSDVPVGCFLSGGIDSPLVAAHVGRPHGVGLPAFTIGSDDPAHDEVAAAKGYAQSLCLDHRVGVLTGQEALAMLPHMAAAYSEPFADVSAIPTMALTALARTEVKVALSGDGGDELFWGYPRFAKVLAARKAFHLPRSARTLAYAASRATGGGLPRGVLSHNIGSWYLDSHSHLRSRDLASVLLADPGLPATFAEFELATVPSHAATAAWLRKNELRVHLQRILLKVDRASMYHGLEVRVPLLDPGVVAVAAAMDPRQCIVEGQGKAVLRQALARHAPGHLVGLPKRGFSAPVSRWLRTQLRPLVHDLLLSRDPYPAGFFRKAGIAELFERHLAGGDHSAQIWPLLALQLWADAHASPIR